MRRRLAPPFPTGDHPTMSHPTPFTAARHAAAALLASYAFTWGLVAFGVAALTGLGLDFHDAETAWLLVAFLVFLPLFLWSFAAPRRGPVLALLFGGAALLSAAAWALQRGLLA